MDIIIATLQMKNQSWEHLFKLCGLEFNLKSM